MEIAITKPYRWIPRKPALHDRMTVDDWRGLAPLIYRHVNPCGRIELDGEKRLPITA